MEEKDTEALIYASEQVNSILILSNLTQTSIENDAIEKLWDLHSIFNIINILSEKALTHLREIQN